ncbi:MAG TPA: hypothetical protein VEX13_04985, partial [Chloroflexia bacterium]|nr:hypothetical protein [Chloroflexia bacterium]
KGNPLQLTDKYTTALLNDWTNGQPVTTAIVNNVGHIVLEQPSAGEYEVRIVASNTLGVPQGYALCVCGELVSDLTRVS